MAVNIVVGDGPAACSSVRFGRFALVCLIYIIGVILVGAAVRALGAGAGCGKVWPLCEGVLVPISPQWKTMLEYSHRATSGIALILVFGLAIWATRDRSVPRLARKGAWAALLLIVVEALLGAGLVLFELVADDRSWQRAIAVAIHLANTLFLLAAIAVTWWGAVAANVGAALSASPPAASHRGGGSLASPGEAGVRLRRYLRALVASYVLVAVLGAIVALSDTLFPPNSLREGIASEFTDGAQWMTRLRIVHVAIAILVGAAILDFSRRFKALVGAGADAARYARVADAMTYLVWGQWGVGIINVLTLTPLLVQLLHLALADLLWVAIVVSYVALLSRERVPATIDARPA